MMSHAPSPYDPFANTTNLHGDLAPDEDHLGAIEQWVNLNDPLTLANL